MPIRVPRHPDAGGITCQAQSLAVMPVASDPSLREPSHGSLSLALLRRSYWDDGQQREGPKVLRRMLFADNGLGYLPCWTRSGVAMHSYGT